MRLTHPPGHQQVLSLFNNHLLFLCVFLLSSWPASNVHLYRYFVSRLSSVKRVLLFHAADGSPFFICAIVSLCLRLLRRRAPLSLAHMSITSQLSLTVGGTPFFPVSYFPSTASGDPQPKQASFETHLISFDLQTIYVSYDLLDSCLLGVPELEGLLLE